MISKKLLSEVLSLQKFIITSIKKEDAIFCNNCITINFYHSKDNENIAGYERINIYELAFKIKEWAKEKGYYLQTGLLDENNHKGNNGFVYIKEQSDIYWFEDKTELEVIFKAGEWVLKQMKKGK